MNNTLKSMLIAAAALTAVSSFAQDKSTLDLLVKKGVITAEERAAALEESSNARAASGINRVFPKEDATKRLTFGGYFQTQFENFGSTYTAANGTETKLPSQHAFIMRRLYLDITADVGEGISGNVVLDMSGNTASSSTSSLDRAMLSLAGEYGTIDFGYKKVVWGYEESTLSSLFKASSSKLLTVERGITNRYWNEAVSTSSGRLGFGAHHTGLHYTSVVNPQGFEYGAAVVNGSRDFNAAGGGVNDLGLYANLVYNYKVSDSEKYAIGVNYGKNRYYTTVNALASSNTNVTMEGYNPFIQAQYFNWTVMGEYFSTKVNDTAAGHTPTGYNATVTYKLNDNWEAVARYTALDTDGRGQQISAGVRDYKTGLVTGTNDAQLFNKSNAYYLGVNYYFTMNALGSAVYGPNAKIQFGYERSKFEDALSSSSLNSAITTGAGAHADVDAIRLQAQVAF